MTRRGARAVWVRGLLSCCSRVSWRGRPRPLLIGEFLVVLCLLRVYDFVRAHAEVRAGAAMQHGHNLLQTEALLRIDIEHGLNHWAERHHLVTFLASHWYQFAHVPVTLCVLGWIWVRHPAGYRRARNALVLVNLIGLAVFLLLPVAPPRLLPNAGFIDSVANAGFGPSHGGPIKADQYGAMPSLHLAWAVWSTVVVRRFIALRALRLCWLVYPALTTVAVVLTGNHYLLDAAVGTAVALFALAMWPSGPAAAIIAAAPATTPLLPVKELAVKDLPVHPVPALMDVSP